MKKILIYIFSIILVVVGSVRMSMAQDNNTEDEYIKGKLMLKLKPYKDKVVLRWAIDNSTAWMVLRSAGIKIDRIILDEKNNPIGRGWETITPVGVKPWNETVFKTVGLPDSTNDALMMVGEVLFGSSVLPNATVDNLGSIQDAGMEFDNKFLMAFMAADMDAKAADALGTRYEDMLVVNPNYKYAYKIYPAIELPPVFQIDTAFYITQGSLKDEKHGPVSLMGDGGDKVIHLTLPKNPFYNTYSSYYFERSIDGRNFKQIHDKPVAFNQIDSVSSYLYRDSVDNYVTYYYRARGKDAFGDMSEYSNVASAMGVNTIAPPKGLLFSSLNGEEVTLTWVQDRLENRPLAGFVVRRGKTAENLDEYLTDKLLPPTQLEFKDRPSDLLKGVYYQVVAMDTAGNYSGTNVQYVFAYDSIPPAAPLGLYGTVDSTGIARLSWKTDKVDNIQGYRVFTSHSLSSDFSPITSDLIRDTVFIDTLDRSVLNKRVFYKFVAVDGNNNHSPFSEVLMVERPKMVKTPAPVIQNYLVSKNAVSFNWAIPNASDHKAIKVLRRIASDTAWTTIADLAINIDSYEDKTVAESRQYDYAIATIDDKGRWSEISYPLSVFVYANDPDQVNEAKMKEKDGKVILSWKIPKNSNVKFFILYKDNGEGLEQFESVSGADREIVLEKEKSRKFGIRIVYDDQKRSELTLFE